jgi:hypothetical protein
MTLSTREADAAFADVVYADQQWVDAEFDALISASFSKPPAPPPPAPPRHPAPALPAACARPGRPHLPGHRAGLWSAALPPGASPGRPPGRRPCPLAGGGPHDSNQHRADGKEDGTKTPLS